MNGSPTPAKSVVMSPPSDEWLPWTEYVYLWVCSFPGGTRVKVGMTNNPDRRATEFRTNSPFKATMHLVCQCPSRDRARELERGILDRYGAANVRGEWLHIEARRIHAFAANCTAIARRVIGPEVRFRDYKPRRPNGEKFGRRR